MSLQARFNPQDPRLYSPDRDVAHAFKNMVRIVAERIENDEWEIVTDIKKKYQLTDQQLGQICRSFCLFVMSSTEQRESMSDCLTRSGWFEQPEAAQLIYMALLGTVVSGYFFAGVREARCLGDDPVLTGDDLRAIGNQCARAMAIPRWRRGLTLWWQRIRQALAALRGRQPNQVNAPTSAEKSSGG